MGAPSAAASLAEGLRKLADAVEEKPALLSLAADSMAVDFMAVSLSATCPLADNELSSHVP